MNKEIAPRLRKCRQLLAAQKLNAAYFTLPASVCYLSGYRGADASLLIINGRRWLFTDSRYEEEARRDAAGCRVVIWQQSMAAQAAECLQKAGEQAFGVEADEFSLRDYNIFTARKLRPQPLAPEFSNLRAVKNAQEIAAIKHSVQIAETAFRTLKPRLHPGMKELEIKAELEYLALQAGAEAMAFPTIVAVGANASLPHATAGQRQWKAGAPLLIDFGIMAGGYVSDLTRTLFAGKVSPFWRTRYQAVLDAQAAGIAAIKAGADGKAPDAAARAALQRAGFHEYFIHSLGHGIGLQFHEAPRLSRVGGILPENSVVTVEPGVYFPGKGGIRIEDDVRVTAENCEVLSTLEKELADCVL